MAGTIEHVWDGSILTVTSDSGTSSSDLKGPKGDVGPRGPQGAPGVIYDAAGKLVLDLSPYVTQEELEAAVSSVEPDMSDYASKTYVSTEIAKAQMEGAGVDTSGFLTKEDVESLEVNIDNKTIIKNADGTIRTALGGYANNGGGVDYKLNGITYTPSGPWNNYVRVPVGRISKDWVAGCLYHITMTFKDGDVVTFDAMFELKEAVYAGEIDYLSMVSEYKNEFLAKVNTSHGIVDFYVGPTNWATSFGGGDFAYGIRGDEDGDGVCADKHILTDITIKADDYVTIDGHYIPVDGNTIYVNDDGNLACSVQVGEDGSIDLNNYYTKSEVDTLIENIPTSDGGSSNVEVDLSDYYTKSEVDAKLIYSTTDLTAGVSLLTTGTLYIVYV